MFELSSRCAVSASHPNTRGVHRLGAGFCCVARKGSLGEQGLGLGAEGLRCAQVGNWEAAKRLAGHLQACGVNPVHHEPAAKALCKLVAKHLAPLARALYPGGAAAPSVLDEAVRPPTCHLPLMSALPRAFRGSSGFQARNSTPLA